MTTLRLSQEDAVLAMGSLYAVTKVNPNLVELRPLDGEREGLSLSHQELLGLLAKGRFSIEYGYFGSRQAARRAVAGKALVSKLPRAEQGLIFWKVTWCEAFLVAEASGEVSRSDKSCSAFIPALELRVAARLQEAGQNAPMPATVALRRPCRTSLMGWVRSWEKTRDPMNLAKRSRFNGTNCSATIKMRIARQSG